VPGGIDVTLEVTAPEKFMVGKPGRYEIQVRSIGVTRPPGATIVQDVLPLGQSLAGTEGAGWACVADDRNVTCTHAERLAVGEEAPFAILVNTDADALPAVTHRATVFANLDQNVDNNSSPAVLIPVEIDVDDDGILDADDNCREVANAGQEDTDGDGSGNECDIDVNGDGVDDELHVSPGGLARGCAQAQGSPLALFSLLALVLASVRRRSN
jgi:hypothetical protein